MRRGCVADGPLASGLVGTLAADLTGSSVGKLVGLQAGKLVRPPTSELVDPQPGDDGSQTGDDGPSQELMEPNGEDGGAPE